MPKQYNFFEFDEVTSTNDVCLSEFQKSTKPTVVVANSQTKGRGRNAKNWDSPKGNISYSLCFKSPSIDPGITVKIGLITSIAVFDIFNKDVLLKWPNDLIFNNKKVGGILVESQNQNNEIIITIGIGINLNIDKKHHEWNDIGLIDITKKTKDSFIEMLTLKLLKLKNLNRKNWSKEWDEKCMHIGKRVTLGDKQESFLFEGITDSGQAKLKKKSGDIELFNESSLKVDGLY
jgi:BirA family biotin operon repressor/biotin-[acetyl-CoA-carboxylase] ligase